MSFQKGPKFKRIEINQDPEISDEMGKEIVKAWDQVMINLGYLHTDTPTKQEREEAVREAALDGISVVPSKRVYNHKEIIYDIVIQQIGAEIVFERGDADSQPLQ